MTRRSLGRVGGWFGEQDVVVAPTTSDRASGDRPDGEGRDSRRALDDEADAGRSGPGGAESGDALGDLGG